MQLYDRGIRRRLAPMLEGDERRIRLALSLMFTLPGSPVLWYGDEIGMGDDLSLEERNSVRTPMQWTAERNGGFSTAPTKDLIRPAIARGPFAYSRVNVHIQEPDRGSLMNEVAAMIRQRKVHNAFGWGAWRPVDATDAAVFALRAEYQDDCVVAVHNLADRACTVMLDLDGDEGLHLLDVHGDRMYDAPQKGQIELGPYGYRWFRSRSLVP
jgi:maltose alpha-D-glucosyltransferase/alpha-amylase